MRYTYKDLLEDVTKIPIHRLDSAISTFVENDDTYYVLCKTEIEEEKSIPPRWDKEHSKPQGEEFLLGPLEDVPEEVQKIVNEIKFPKLEL
jgi:hypothetical protein